MSLSWPAGNTIVGKPGNGRLIRHCADRVPCCCSGTGVKPVDRKSVIGWHNTGALDLR